MHYFTSDTHFGHTNIIRYCGRPFIDAEEMRTELIRRWNEVVGPADSVYHLGDFAMGQKTLWRSYRQALNGRIHYIVGNHDAPLDRFVAECVDRSRGDDFTDHMLYESPQYGRVHLAHVPVGGDPARGFVRCGEGTPADFYLCGHIHSEWLREGSCINVGVDMWDFRPQTLETIITKAYVRSGERVLTNI